MFPYLNLSKFLLAVVVFGKFRAENRGRGKHRSKDKKRKKDKKKGRRAKNVGFLCNSHFCRRNPLSRDVTHVAKEKPKKE